MAVARTENEWRPDMPKIFEIQLRKGYAAVRTRQDKQNPQIKERQLTLWRHDHAGEAPACSPLQSSMELIVWMGSFPAQLQGIASQWTFSGRVAGNPRIQIRCDPWDIPADQVSLFQNSVAFTYGTVTFDDGGDMPWGFKDDIIWSATFTYEGITASVPGFSRTHLELYAVSPKLPAYYLSGGVPLELLQLFVEPASKVSTLHNLDDWVAWVVRRCHASRADKIVVGKEASPNEVPVQDRIHYFVYDIWHGANNYTGGGYGRTFHLDSWLDDYNKKAAGNTVNCYDQAAIVQLVTLLGVPDGRIRWMFKEPFGYIRDTDLVGWGKTNNPFYRNIDTDKEIPAPEKMLDRSNPFKNHAFISYMKTGSDSWFALDACAGPVTGDKSVQQYLTDDIDDGYDSVKESNITTGPKGYYQEYKRTINSEIADNQLAVTAVDPDNKGLGVTTVRNGTESQWWATSTDRIMTYDDLKNFGPKMAEGWANFASFVKTTPDHPKKIDLGAFFIAFQAKANERLPAASAEGRTFNFQRPWNQSVDGKKIFYQAGMDVLALGAPRSLVSLTVKVMDTADNAVAEAGQWLGALSKDMRSLFAVPVEGDRHLGHMHLAAKAPNGLNVFCYENILVWVDADDYDVGVALAADAEKLISDATGETDALAMTIDAPTEAVKEWDVFKVTVSCDGATDVTVDDDDSRFFNTSWTRVGNTWTFDFVVLGKELWTDAGESLPEAADGVDGIAFIAVNQDGGVPHVKEVDVKIA
ncbi:hypothetical protein CONLIGDRAFT_683974 [Coniochaeta ligniaria NRRL 30616]|uniref:Uncharacterized protein n=1 Tax=Coniochaeta ligniaria NRRL 30616 TaxID=1408157 RepID=A0A1J7JCR3_9PEZI|nr:hypothetical protein CONLIGDRAFT_683974 [Coniochaeta ligniaria NRRL 30616]